MTITLTPKLEAQLKDLVAAGKFDSPEHFVAYALATYSAQEALLEDATFAARAKTALEESEADIRAGRVRSVATPEAHRALYDDVIERGEARRKAEAGHAE